jgi:putative transposase
MPQKHSIKIYVKNGFYHVYNRGVEKRTIFEDEKDYKVFLSYLKEYLSPPPDSYLQGGTLKAKCHENFSDEIELHCFCLMPNHFHFLIRQNQKNSMQRFLKSLLTRYSMYFNKKYKRVGKLFQGHYKAILVTEDGYLLHLSRYIHRNPYEYTKDLLSGTYSSYANYLGLGNTTWLNTDFILKFFNKINNMDFLKVGKYKDFVEKYETEELLTLGDLTLDMDT